MISRSIPSATGQPAPVRAGWRCTPPRCTGGSTRKSDGLTIRRLCSPATAARAGRWPRVRDTEIRESPHCPGIGQYLSVLSTSHRGGARFSVPRRQSCRCLESLHFAGSLALSRGGANTLVCSIETPLDASRLASCRTGPWIGLRLYDKPGLHRVVLDVRLDPVPLPLVSDPVIVGLPLPERFAGPAPECGSPPEPVKPFRTEASGSAEASA